MLSMFELNLKKARKPAIVIYGSQIKKTKGDITACVKLFAEMDGRIPKEVDLYVVLKAKKKRRKELTDSFPALPKHTKNRVIFINRGEHLFSEKVLSKTGPIVGIVLHFNYCMEDSEVYEAQKRLIPVVYTPSYNLLPSKQVPKDSSLMPVLLAKTGFAEEAGIYNNLLPKNASNKQTAHLMHIVKIYNKFKPKSLNTPIDLNNLSKEEHNKLIKRSKQFINVARNSSLQAITKKKQATHALSFRKRTKQRKHKTLL